MKVARDIPTSPWLPSARAYFSELNNSIKSLLTRYAVAAVALICFALCLLGATGVGLSALHYWVALHYGPFQAYAALAGVLIGGGLAFLSLALIVLKQSVQLPKPDLRPQAISREVLAPLLRRAQLVRQPPDQTTQLLATVAGFLLLGWTLQSLRTKRRYD